MAAPPPAVLAIWSSLIEDHAGLHYAPENRELLADKLAERATERDFESLLDYYYYVRYDPGGPAELDQLVRTLVVGETYFFRELAPLETAVQSVVRPIVERGERARVWSAACATGEEPLTLAMVLADRGLLDGVELRATDINSDALERARANRFGSRSVRDVLPARLWRWLSMTAGGYSVAPEIHAAVDWRALNLVDEEAVAAMGRDWDLILCRNVLIYFSDATALRVVSSLTDALGPGGVLLVGASESLLRFGTSLACEEHDRSFFYRKTG